MPITIMVSLLRDGLSHDLVTAWADLHAEVSSANTHPSWPHLWRNHIYRDWTSICLSALFLRRFLDAKRCDTLCPYVNFVFGLWLRMSLINLHWLRLLIIRIECRGEILQLHCKRQRFVVRVLYRQLLPIGPRVVLMFQRFRNRGCLH